MKPEIIGLQSAQEAFGQAIREAADFLAGARHEKVNGSSR
jgi:hypothetical protein